MVQEGDALAEVLNLVTKCCGEFVLEQFAHGGDKSALSLLAARYRVGLRLPLARSLVNVSGADF